MYSNAQKLSAIVARWLSPMADQLATMKLSSLPFLANLEAKVKSTGWVSPGYCLMNDLSPIMKPIITSMLEPAISGLVSGLPDESIPSAVHGIVDTAIANCRLELLEGKICFTREDLYKLKNLLDKNLPIVEDSFEIVE